MLKELYLHFGGVGTALISLVLALTMISWIAAVSGVAASNWRWSRKLVLQGLLVVLPPLSILFLSLFVVANHRSNRRAALFG